MCITPDTCTIATDCPGSAFSYTENGKTWFNPGTSQCINGICVPNKAVQQCSSTEECDQGVCVNGQCLDVPNCGDGNKDENEQCDDGCGTDDICDSTDNGDGCSQYCQIEQGWDCITDVNPSSCYDDPREAFINKLGDCSSAKVIPALTALFTKTISSDQEDLDCQTTYSNICNQGNKICLALNKRTVRGKAELIGIFGNIINPPR
ncbi:hypothetical protein HYU21_02665 [Candidatus Woesearchaeota archaeon]|nr:hypothetical protein [Candidatus Woesearchaeota archaeon]